MRKSLVLLGVAAAVALLATSAFADNRGASFTGIGFISGPLCVAGANAGNPCTTNADCPGSRCQAPASQVWDMNADATLFMVSPSFAGTYMTLWTREGGWGDQIGSVSGIARLSASGNTVVGNGIYPGSSPAYAWPGTWTGVVDVWDPIPENPGYAPCGTSRMSYHSSPGGEGDYGAGLTWSGCAYARAFKWDKATDTSVELGSPNTRSTRANAISDDGSIVYGWGTALFGTRRAAIFENGTVEFVGDPNGLEPKTCVGTQKGCTSNSADPTFGCPDQYVDDGSCPNDSKGVCTAGICVGGFDAGKTCTSSSQCGGTCAGGPNNGLRCTSNGSCPDTPVCLPNPEWTDDLFKGEIYDATPDGMYAVGRNYDYSANWDSGFRYNRATGMFDQMPPAETWPYLVDPFRVSDDGSTAVGNLGTRLTGTAPFFWREGLGTIDLQYFLLGQGLDELFFWYLSQASTVSADGTVIAGYGVNPDNWLEGWIVDISKVWVCHAPGGDMDKARTLGVGIDSAADHVGHGDFLGTCEFLNSGGLSRAAEMNLRRSTAAVTGIGREIESAAFDSWQPQVKSVGGRHSIAAPERKQAQKQR